MAPKAPYPLAITWDFNNEGSGEVCRYRHSTAKFIFKEQRLQFGRNARMSESISLAPGPLTFEWPEDSEEHLKNLKQHGYSTSKLVKVYVGPNRTHVGSIQWGKKSDMKSEGKTILGIPRGAKSLEGKRC